jgi:hypothetical protein
MKLKYIKRDRALLLTSILLMLMLAAGLFSGIVGFTLGHAALKGVTQPDIRRSNKTSSEYTNTKGLDIIPETQLISESQDIMGTNRKTEADKFKTDEKVALVFPIESKDQGIIMTIKSAKLEGNVMKLDVGIQNQGSQPVKFNQSSLTVVGEKEEPIPFTVTGLPPSLVANGKDVNFKIAIPKTVVKNVNIRLTDVDRKLAIEANNVPLSQAAAKPPIKISIPDGQLSTTKEEDDKLKNVKPEKSANPEKSPNPTKPGSNAKPSVKPSPKPPSPSAKAVKPPQPTSEPVANPPITVPTDAPSSEAPVAPAAEPQQQQ